MTTTTDKVLSDIKTALSYAVPALTLADAILAASGAGAPLAAIGAVAVAGAKALEDGISVGLTPEEITAKVDKIIADLKAGLVADDASAEAALAAKFPGTAPTSALAAVKATIATAVARMAPEPAAAPAKTISLAEALRLIAASAKGNGPTTSGAVTWADVEHVADVLDGKAIAT